MNNTSHIVQATSIEIQPYLFATVTIIVLIWAYMIKNK